MSECLPGCICMCGHEEDIHLDGRCWRAEGPGPMYCGCSDYEPKVHAPHCHKNAPKPEPPPDAPEDTLGPPNWAERAEPPPDVAKKHYWTTPDANPDGPIICRYCEVMMTKETESGECEGKPPDEASEPDFEMADKWAKSCHPGIDKTDWMHAQAYLALRAENAALKAQNEQLRQSSARVAEENQVLKAKLENLPADWWEDSSLATWFPFTAAELARAKSDCEKAEAERDEARAEVERREMENSRLVIELAKLREERGVLKAEAQKLRLEVWGWKKDATDVRAAYSETRAEVLYYRKTGRDISHEAYLKYLAEFDDSARKELRDTILTMETEIAKLLEERDAAVIEPGIKAFATGVGDGEDSTIQFENSLVHVVERKRKGWWYVRNVDGELFLVHEKNLVRRREEKGGE